MHTLGLSGTAKEILLSFEPDVLRRYPCLVIDPVPSIKGIRWPDGKFRSFENTTEKVVKNALQELIDAGLISRAGFDGYRITLEGCDARSCRIKSRGTTP